MLHSHRRFARVVKTRRELGARIVDIGPCHSWGERWGWFGRKQIRFVVFRILRGWWSRWLLRLGRRRSCGLRRLGLHSIHTETKNKNGSHSTQEETQPTVHYFSSDFSFFNMPSIIRISARCELSASVAKLNNSAS